MFVWNRNFYFFFFVHIKVNAILGKSFGMMTHWDT